MPIMVNVAPNLGRSGHRPATLRIARVTVLSSG